MFWFEAHVFFVIRTGGRASDALGLTITASWTTSTRECRRFGWQVFGLPEVVFTTAGMVPLVY